MTNEEAKELMEEIEVLSGEDMEKAHKMAIKALKKQIPKKIVVEKWIYTECECGHNFSVHYGDGYYDVPHENKTNYCPDCGQRIDWKGGV